jgi:hypothetical protein
MKIIDLIFQNKLSEAKEHIYDKLNIILDCKIEQYKKYVSENITVTDSEDLTEANLVRMGRVTKIRRRIRRNKQGRIVVQRNRKRSAVKGFRISGNKLKRITAVQRINKARKLKRYWKSKGRATLQRRKLKQKMSIRRRKSMGIR